MRQKDIHYRLKWFEDDKMIRDQVKRETITTLRDGIWAVDALRPLVTLIKYIDFRVFTDSGGIWVGAQQKSHMGS